MNKGTFYITTAIHYPNADPHVGTCFEMVGADVLARYKRLTGYQVLFLTGMDEHGEKVEKAARDRGITPKQHVDQMAEKFAALWENLEISNDDFIRTTEPRHERVAVEVFRRVQAHGDIYKGTYQGPYCVRCETFLTESKLQDGRCPSCGDPVERLSEEAYFFRMSRYQKALQEHIEKNPSFIEPDFRRREMLANFVEPGLEDVCISRSSITWGIPVPGDPKHVLYVWFDALVNYLTGAGFPEDGDLFERFWPAQLHVLGKDVVRWHTTIWPTMLLAAELPLPERVYGHGFVNAESGDKISKSAGAYLTPQDLIDRYGADALRYFLLREIPYASDGIFSERNLVTRLNSDLGNDLGNLLHRTLSMIELYCQGRIPSPGALSPGDEQLPEAVAEMRERLEKHMNALEFSQALDAIWNVVRIGNRYVEENKPWLLAKEPAHRPRLDGVLYNLAELLRILGVSVSPFIPASAAELTRQLGLPSLEGTLDELAYWALLPTGLAVIKGEPLFPKVEAV